MANFDLIFACGPECAEDFQKRGLPHTLGPVRRFGLDDMADQYASDRLAEVGKKCPGRAGTRDQAVFSLPGRAVGESCLFMIDRQ